MTRSLKPLLRLTLIVFVLAGFSAGMAQAQVDYLFVDPDDATAGGTMNDPSDPWTTISGAVGSAGSGDVIAIAPETYAENVSIATVDIEFATWEAGTGTAAGTPGGGYTTDANIDIDATVVLNGDLSLGDLDTTPPITSTTGRRLVLREGFTLEIGQNRVLNLYSDISDVSNILGPGGVRAAVASGQLTINVEGDPDAPQLPALLDDLVVDKAGGTVSIQRDPSDPNTRALLIVGIGTFLTPGPYSTGDTQGRLSVLSGTVDATNSNILFVGSTGFGPSPSPTSPVLNVNQSANISGLGTLVSLVFGSHTFTATGTGDMGMLFAQAIAPLSPAGTTIEWSSIGNGGTSFVLSGILRAPNLETINGSLTASALLVGPLGDPTRVLASSLTSITGNLNVGLNNSLSIASTEVQVGGTSLDVGGGTTTAKSQHSLSTGGNTNATDEVDNPGEDIEEIFNIAEEFAEFPEQNDDNGEVEGAETKIAAGPRETVLDVNVPATFQGAFTADEATSSPTSDSRVNFADDATFNSAFTALTGVDITFNGNSTFNGATLVDIGSGGSMTFNPSSPSSTSEVAGLFDFDSGTIWLRDNTNGSHSTLADGLHHLELNGNSEIETSGTEIDQEEDGDDVHNQVRVAGGASPHTMTLLGSGTFDVDRFVLRHADGLNLLAPGGASLGINYRGPASLNPDASDGEDGRLLVQDGVFTTNGNLDADGSDEAPGAFVARYGNTQEHGQIGAGTAGEAYVGSAGTRFHTPHTVAYKGPRPGISADPINMPTGDELISQTKAMSHRTIPWLIVNVQGQASQPVVTLGTPYTATERVGLYDGNLSIGSAELNLASGVDVYIGDGTFDPGATTPEEENLNFPAVASGAVGTGGINLFYVNTDGFTNNPAEFSAGTVETGLEWPENGAPLDGGPAMNVINSVQIHPSGTRVNTNNPDVDHDFATSPAPGAGSVALAAGSTYRVNGFFWVGPAVAAFNYNGQILETNAPFSTVFLVSRPGWMMFDPATESAIHYLGSGDHIVVGVTGPPLPPPLQTANGGPGPGAPFAHPLAVVNKTGGSSTDRGVFYFIDDLNTAQTDPGQSSDDPYGGKTDPLDGFYYAEDYIMENGDNSGPFEGVFVLDDETDEFGIAGNLMNNAGSGFFHPMNRLWVGGDVVKDTKTDEAELHLIAHDWVNLDQSVYQRSGGTSKLFSSLAIGEDGLFIGTPGSFSVNDPTLNEVDEPASVVNIGQDVMSEKGVLSITDGAFGFLGPPVVSPQGVNIGGNYTLTNGSVGSFTGLGTFVYGPAKSVTVEGNMDVAGGDQINNFGMSAFAAFLDGFADRSETLTVGSYRQGAAAAATTAKDQHAMQASAFAYTRDWFRQRFFDVLPEVDCPRQSRRECLEEVLGVTLPFDPDGLNQELQNVEGQLSENVSDVLPEGVLGVPSDHFPEFGSRSESKASSEAKTAHGNILDTWTVTDGPTTISDGARIFLGGFKFAHASTGNFTFNGNGDVIASNDPSPATDTDRGLQGLLAFNNEEPVEVTVAEKPGSYLNGLEINGAGIQLTTNVTLNTMASGVPVPSVSPPILVTNATDSDYDDPFGTLFLDQGNVYTQDNMLTVLQPTPTSGCDLFQAVNADETSAAPCLPGSAGHTPIIGGTRNSGIEGTLRRAIQQRFGSTGGFVGDGYNYPMVRQNPETGNYEFHSLVLSLATDALGQSRFFTVETVADPGVDLPDDLTAPAINTETNEEFDLDLNIQSRPYFQVSFDQMPDQNFNVRSIAGGLGGINDIKQMRIIQRDAESGGDWQLAGVYDFTGDPNDDFPAGPNSFISGIPNVIHEGVDLREGGMLALASQGDINPLGNATGAQLAGNVYYAPDDDQGIADATVTATSSTETLSTTTGNNGGYSIASVPQGDYEVTASNVPGTPTGINATDALVAVRAFAGLESLNAVQEEIADVNDSGSVNSTDALLIAQFAAGSVSSFQAGTFYSTTNSITVQAQNVTADIYVAAYGDVNLSGGVASSSSATIASKSVPTNGEISVPQEGSFELPLKAASSAELGAYQATLEYPQDKLRFEGVTSGQQVLAHAANGTVKVVWFDRNGDQPLTVGKGDVLTSLKFSTRSVERGSDLEVKVADSKFASLDASSLKMTAQVPAVKVGTTPDEFVLKGNYPNPVQEQTRISFALPSEAKVTVRIYDQLGRKVATVPRKSMSAGPSKSVRVDGSTLPSGVYFYRIEADTQSKTIRETGRMTVVK